MSSHTVSSIFVIGGTGAQGMPIVRDLVADGKYSVRVLTRDTTSPRAEVLLSQNQSNGVRMGAAIFTSGPYIEMAISPLTPMTPAVEDGVVTWRVPLGQGAVPHVALDDCGYYVRWLFDHPRLANGMNLEVAIGDITYTELAAAFEKVTGHAAQYIDTALEDYWAG